jgi:hypothetical protein
MAGPSGRNPVTRPAGRRDPRRASHSAGESAPRTPMRPGRQHVKYSARTGCSAPLHRGRHPLKRTMRNWRASCRGRRPARGTSRPPSRPRRAEGPATVGPCAAGVASRDRHPATAYSLSAFQGPPFPARPRPGKVPASSGSRRGRPQEARGQACWPDRCLRSCHPPCGCGPRSGERSLARYGRWRARMASAKPAGSS